MSGVTSGITVSEELSDQFQQSSGTRVIKVSIENESLVVSKTLPLTSSLSTDVQSISSIVEANVAAYLLVQQDMKGRWILVSYVPDTAPVRQKMLYASTRNALTRGLGASAFVDSAFISSSSELASTLSTRTTPSAGGGPARSATSPGLIPLSSRETELADIAAAEAKERARDNTPRSQIHRSGMSWEPEAEAAIADLKEGDGKLVILGVQTSKEKDVIVLKNSTIVPVGHGLTNALPKGEPSYVFYTLSTGGQPSILFIFFCPDDSSIKDKMVHAGSRWNVILKAEEVGSKPARRVRFGLNHADNRHSCLLQLETTELSELTHEYLISELYPDGPPVASGAAVDDTPAATMSAQRGFARPTRPGRRPAV
ncbi:actin depolymerizing protein [Calocera viscosa TUFC12733]|uniref:Actin depolymerizing protein n=1 Tax=Calocera viscosa (strain TUFC12733) TaxID=1330018 RepID=A0A167NHK7_CALVF|nr:actin depolymerizing protein [Calocera viscosa TUFC12733]